MNRETGTRRSFGLFRRSFGLFWFIHEIKEALVYS